MSSHCTCHIDEEFCFYCKFTSLVSRMDCYYCGTHKAEDELYMRPICEWCKHKAKTVSTSAPLHKMDNDQKARMLQIALSVLNRGKKAREGKE